MRAREKKICARFIQKFCSFVPLIYEFLSCRTQNSAYAYHLHFCWRTAYQGSAYRIPSKKVGIRRTEKGGYSLVIVMTMKEVIAVNQCASGTFLHFLWLSVNFMPIFVGTLSEITNRIEVIEKQ